MMALQRDPLDFTPGDAESLVTARFPHAKQRANGGWQVCCLVHDDKNPSLSIDQGDRGIILRCHAGCTFGAICEALGVPQSAMFKPDDKPRLQKHVTRYPYYDEHGNLLYYKCRRDLPNGKKSMWVEQPNGTKQMGDAAPSLYRLYHLRHADPTEVVWFVEGEKCVEALVDRGLLATTSGGDTSWLPEFARYFKGRVVVILPDNDDGGRRYAQEVAADLAPVASRVMVLDLPGLSPKGDIYNWLAAGHTLDDLEALATDCPSWEPAAYPPEPTEPPQAEYKSSTWADVGVVVGNVEMLWPRYIPLAMLSAVVAQGDAGKSQFSLHLVKCVRYGGLWPDGAPVTTTGAVIWLDTEGSDLITFQRMVKWGIKPEDIIRPRVGDDLLDSVLLDTPQGLEALEREIIIHQPRLVVIDTLRGAHTQKERDDDAMQGLLKSLATMATRYRPAMLLNHHITKKHPAENLDVITLDRVRGSSVIVNMARAILALDKPNPESERRRLHVVKNNLAPKADPLGMDIHENGLTFTREVPSTPARDTTFNRAIEFLKARLADGPDLTSVLETDAAEQGISEPTLNRARKMLGVISLGKTDKGWLISLPAKGTD